MSPDVAVLTQRDALETLRPEWLELLDRAANVSPFQRPEWLIPWWSCFGRGQPWVLTARRNDRLIGVLPLYLDEPDDEGARWLRLIGSGNTDHLGAILESGHELECAGAFFDHIVRRGDDWDACDLQQLDPASPLLHPAAPDHVQDEIVSHEPCPVLELPCATEPDPVRHVVPSSILRKLRYYRRRAERAGDVHIEQATEETIAEHLRALVTLHGRRWRERGESGVLEDDRVREFLGAAARALLGAGALRLYALRLDGRIIAVHLGLLHAGHACYYIGGFEPEFEKLNPGTIIVGHAIEAAADEGAGVIDFLRGREPYKYRWGATDRPTRRRTLRRRPTHSARS